jgi:hypothetical protein
MTDEELIKGCLFNSRVDSSDAIVTDLIATGFTDKTADFEVSLVEVELVEGEHDPRSPMPSV